MSGMNEKTLRALVEVGAVKRIRIIGQGSQFHIEADTPNGSVTAVTTRNTLRTWGKLDQAAKWVRKLGFGSAQVDLRHWTPEQKGMRL